MPHAVSYHSCVARPHTAAACTDHPLIILTQSGLVRAVFAVDEQEGAHNSARFWAELYGSAVTKYVQDAHTAAPPEAGSAFRADQQGWHEIGRVEAVLPLRAVRRPLASRKRDSVSTTSLRGMSAPLPRHRRSEEEANSG